ncbi:hypothetical protein F53441_4227 [Fusarium austroafricanum]|uniref:Uncharacterized protein n=1 Tax=Fusarium austroafricanum TaxID=2364996 RepID=A0A8H4KNA3_9HYPO|nr:hypothetical protein F53441_4227 [Fusarium austroafricanum]
MPSTPNKKRKLSSEKSETSKTLSELRELNEALLRERNEIKELVEDAINASCGTRIPGSNEDVTVNVELVKIPLIRVIQLIGHNDEEEDDVKEKD